ncbi:MAG: hypothetical protein ACKPEO_26005 [Sphaerospermopsis kisseleviana]
MGNIKLITQSPVPSHQSPVPSHQSPVPNYQGILKNCNFFGQ